jgi:50S ribosomal protein L16 3-hydroxylase
VFLLQGEGRRRWRYGAQRDRRLRADAPLKILERFTPRHDATLAAGDMLYLPPSVAHDGVAIDICTTYSIGFRAASATELAHAWLDFLRDSVELPGRYADPDLAPTQKPAAINAATLSRFAALLRDFHARPTSFAGFLGQWLSEPKPTVTFDPPAAPLAAAAFARKIARSGARLNRRTHLLYDAHTFYINGAAHPRKGRDGRALCELADHRALTAPRCAKLAASTLTLLREWYCDGYLDL